MKTLFVFLACCLATLPLLSQSALPAHYHCVTSGVNNGLMHPSVSLRHLFIYNRAEIAAMTAPVTGPVAITRIFFRTNNGGTATYTNLNIRMGHTTTPNASTSTTFATNYNVGLPQTVFTAASHTVTMTGSNSGCTVASTWFYIDLTIPFTYDFVNNLVVELSYTAQSGAIPSFYALNPGGGANPSAISGTTTAGATGALTARPMFGISANPLDGDAGQLSLDMQDGTPRLYWDPAQWQDYTQASLTVQGPDGTRSASDLPDGGQHQPALLGSGQFQAWIEGLDMQGSVTRSNAVSWLQSRPFRCHPQPWTDRLTVEFDQAGASATLYDAQGRICWQAQACPTQLELELPLPPGVYFLKVVSADGSSSLRRITKS